MLDRPAALGFVAEHLGDTPRAAHSVLVGRLMRGIATAIGGDADLFEVVGLCHDIDFEETRGEPSRHGVLAATWLRSDLPAEACLAIAAHDHRSGLTSETPIAAALRLADACAVASEPIGAGMAAALREGPPWPTLAAAHAGRPYLVAMIARGMDQLDLAPPDLACLFTASDAA